MVNEFSFGYLYIPTLNKGIFRDIFLFINGQLFCRDYLRCGSQSQLFESVTPTEISQLTQVSVGDVISILGAVPEVAKVVSKLWKKFAQPHNDPQDNKNLWPKTLSKARGDLDKLLFNNLVDLRSDLAIRQNIKIIEDAEEELKVFRVAFSDDLVNLGKYIDKTKQGCKVEFNLASAKSLKMACHNELTELERRNELFTNLRTEFDIQAKSKYMRDPSANFARAACDSLCAIRASQNYIERNSTLDDSKRFKLSLFTGDPSFRGTITEKELGYVSTEPWAPGMTGDLHSQLRDRENKHNWDIAKKKFLAEIKSSMKPIELDFYGAARELSTEAITAIYEAERRPSKTRDDISHLEEMIKAIQYFKPMSKSDIPNVLEQITNHRKLLRDEFGKIFPRLDEFIPSANQSLSSTM
ncbi:MAG TPA: hypothetical protein VIN60_04710 [Anaerolineales bacterium]